MTPWETLPQGVKWKSSPLFGFLTTRAAVEAVLGPPQGVWGDIWPLGEPRAHEPIYKLTLPSD